jgi:transposase
MHMIGYFEGVDSEGGMAARACCTKFMRRCSTSSRSRRRAWLGAGRGDRRSVSTTEANAAMRAIVRRDNAESYRETLSRMAKESGNHG